MTSERSTYSEGVRKRALALYLEVGPAETGKRLGIPAATVRSWAQREGLATVAAEQRRDAVQAARLRWGQRRGQLRERFGEVALDMLDRLPDASPSAAKSLVTAAAICTDKAELLSRAEQAAQQARGPLKPDELDREIAHLLEQVAGKRIGELEAELSAYR